MPTSADKDIISSAIEFWQTLYDSGQAKVKFVKKSDGTVRIMKCTLDFKLIPPDKHPKKVNMPKILSLLQKSGIIHVYDLEKKDWRSVPFQNVDWLEIGTKRFKVRPFTGRRP